MSRIGQLQEQKRQRAELDALKATVASMANGMADLVNQVASLTAAIENAKPIVSAVESTRRGPGRPRKDHAEGRTDRGD
jgi:hypothetical protein